MKKTFAMLLVIGLAGCASRKPAQENVVPYRENNLAEETMVLYRAAASGKVSVLEKAWAQGKDLSFVNPVGINLLMVAARNNQLAAVKYLLAHGADPNAQDLDEQTAMHYALPSKNPELQKALLQAKGDPTRADRFDTVPILRWAEKGQWSLVKTAFKYQHNWKNLSGVKEDLMEILKEQKRPDLLALVR